jgi:hypothetical protein
LIGIEPAYAHIGGDARVVDVEAGLLTVLGWYQGRGKVVN